MFESRFFSRIACSSRCSDCSSASKRTMFNIANFVPRTNCVFVNENENYNEVVIEFLVSPIELSQLLEVSGAAKFRFGEYLFGRLKIAWDFRI